MADEKRFVLTLNNERPLEQVEHDLRGAGFTLEQALHDIGVLTGTSRKGAEALRKVSGVADVSEDAPIDMGPPGSSETW